MPQANSATMMTFNIIGIGTGDDAEEVRRRVEEFRVTVMNWRHNPATKSLTVELTGPDANYLLRNKLNKAGIRPDWVTSGLR